MTYSLLPKEKALIDATLGFANLKQVRSTEEIEKRFGKLALSPYFKVIPPEDNQAYPNDQQQLREWLAEIVASGSVRREIERDIERQLGTVDMRAQLRFKDGELKIEPQYWFSGVQACYTFAVALILSNTEVADRLQRCALEGCGRYFLADNQRQRYCKPEHTLKADAQRAKDRQQRLRDRRKKR